MISQITYRLNWDNFSFVAFRKKAHTMPLNPTATLPHNFQPLSRLFVSNQKVTLCSTFLNPHITRPPHLASIFDRRVRQYPAFKTTSSIFKTSPLEATFWSHSLLQLFQLVLDCPLLVFRYLQKLLLLTPQSSCCLVICLSFLNKLLF